MHKLELYLLYFKLEWYLLQRKFEFPVGPKLLYGVCPDEGWTKFGDHCYTLYPQTRDQDQANEACRIDCGYPVYIMSEEENLFLQKLLWVEYLRFTQHASHNSVWYHGYGLILSISEFVYTLLFFHLRYQFDLLLNLRVFRVLLIYWLCCSCDKPSRSGLELMGRCLIFWGGGGGGVGKYLEKKSCHITIDHFSSIK